MSIEQGPMTQSQASGLVLKTLFFQSAAKMKEVTYTLLSAAACAEAK